MTVVNAEGSSGNSAGRTASMRTGGVTRSNSASMGSAAADVHAIALKQTKHAIARAVPACRNLARPSGASVETTRVDAEGLRTATPAPPWTEAMKRIPLCAIEWLVADCEIGSLQHRSFSAKSSLHHTRAGFLTYGFSRSDVGEHRLDALTEIARTRLPEMPFSG